MPPAASLITTPVWLDNLADDATLEGSAMDGLVKGPEAVRTVLVSIRALYDYQKFNPSAKVETYVRETEIRPGRHARRSDRRSPAAYRGGALAQQRARG
jgi:hypothetical protein